MDPIKAAFQKVKQDIFLLQSQISDLTREIKQLKRTLDQTHTPDKQTHTLISQTDRQIIQTVPHEERGLNPQNSDISTGNEGVQTDRQTHQQTDVKQKKFALERPKLDRIDRIKQVSDVVESLDALKKELRSQFKKLTPQEMLVFSTLYQLTDQGFTVDYSLLSQKTSLSESSIRDYILKIIKKGVPLEKTKENNKRILLTIPESFKKIASLSTINSLREI